MASTMKIEENGDKSWCVNGELHREDGLPAVERADGSKTWYVNGKCHRDGGLPSYEGANGDKEWWVNDKRHRAGGLPAVEWADGSKFWYVDGEHHRDRGLPSIEWANGDRAWYVNGDIHRDGGLPAYEGVNGDKEWWVNGVEYYPDRWTQQPMTPDMVGQTCVISLETIQADSEVCKCGVCHSLSLFGAMEEWLNVNKTCPNCRSRWNNWTKYRN
jgi:hypothetical protein